MQPIPINGVLSDNEIAAECQRRGVSGREVHERLPGFPSGVRAGMTRWEFYRLATGESLTVPEAEALLGWEMVHRRGAQAAADPTMGVERDPYTKLPYV